MEARASSEIENIVTTNDELFRAAHGAAPELTPAVKEALRYREALRAGFEALRHRPITTQSAMDMCTHIHGRPVRIRDAPGTYIGHPATCARIYTPPEGKDVILDHLSAWERFLHGDHGLDPLVVMALAHYQFEAIHPFFNGNGRTGRVINLLLLIEAESLELPVLYLSGHIMRNKEEYYRELNAVTREGAREDWIVFILAGVESTARWALDLVQSTASMAASMEADIHAVSRRLPAGDIARLLFTQAYLRIENVVDAGLAQRQTAAKWLTDVADAGHIKERVGRNAVFINTRLLRALFTTP